MKLESNFNPYAINVNKDKSLDLGIWQLNTKWQKVDREVAFNPTKATQAAYKIYQAWGNTFNAWTTNKLID